MMMYRANKFKQPPEVVLQAGSNLDVEYVSPLARAQRLEEVYAIERWFAQLAGMAQADPAILDVVDYDAIGRLIAKRVGVPAEAMRSEEDVMEIQEQRQAEQQAMQQAAAQQAAIEQTQGAAQAAGAINEAGVDQAAAVAQGLQ